MNKSGTSGADSRELDKQWLLLQVNSILEPMMLEIFNQKPDDNVNFNYGHFIL